MFIGFIVAGTAKNNNAMMAACAFIGFGGGNAQLAAFALPELLPNKWRHVAIVIADLGVYFAVLVGPVAGRFAAESGDSVSVPQKKTNFSYLAREFGVTGMALLTFFSL